MTGFESDKWTIHKMRDDFKFVAHNNFPFIQFDLHRIQKRSKYPPRETTWRISGRFKETEIIKSYKKLDKEKIPELFEELLKTDLMKN